MNYINIDSDYIKKAFIDRGVAQSAASVVLGHQKNHISSNLNAGKMEEGLLKKLCTILDIDMEKAIAKEPEPAPAPQGGGRTKAVNGRADFLYLRSGENSHGNAA